MDAPITPEPSSDGFGQASPGLSRGKDITRATCRIQIDLGAVAQDDRHKKRECGGSGAGCRACSLREDLILSRREAVRAINAALRLHWRADADLLDRFVLSHGRAPKGSEWKFHPDPAALVRAVAPGLPDADGIGPAVINATGNVYTYPLIRALAPRLGSSIAAQLARKAEQKWRQVRYDALLRNSCAPPHYRDTMPLPLPAAAVGLRHLRGSEYIVAFRVRAGRDAIRHEVPIVARDAFMRRVLQELCGGDTKMGAVAIEQDRLRRSRWYLRIAYTRRVVAIMKDTEIVGVVHPGIVTFLCALVGEARWMYDGHDIEAYLHQMQRRRQAYQRDSKGSRRWGHGRSRTIAPIEKLQGKADRWRATKIQTLARRLVTWLAAEGVTRVLMPDFSGVRDGLPEHLRGGEPVWKRIQTWPYFSQQQALKACLDELGMAHETISVSAPGRTCPQCLHISDDNLDLVRRMLRCVECGHQEHLDTAMCRNILREWRSSEEEAVP